MNTIMDVTPYIDTIDPKARDANTAEREFYLRWLARSRGVYVPADATFTAEGIHERFNGAVILDMPGYGQSQTVTCEILDDGGNVVRTLPLPVDKSGKLPMTAAQAKEWTGITPARKTRAKASPAAATVSPDLLQRLEAVEAENARLRADLAGARAEAAALARRLEGKRAARFAGAALMAPPVPSLVLAR
jgi:hypothetical protein